MRMKLKPWSLSSRSSDFCCPASVYVAPQYSSSMVMVMSAPRMKGGWYTPLPPPLADAPALAVRPPALPEAPLAVAPDAPGLPPKMPPLVPPVGCVGRPPAPAPPALTPPALTPPPPTDGSPAAPLTPFLPPPAAPSLFGLEHAKVARVSSAATRRPPRV